MSKPAGGPNMNQAAKRPDGYDDWVTVEADA
jgi:hypothetical protein